MSLGTPTMLAANVQHGEKVTSGSFTPAANSLIIVTVGSRSENAITLTDTLGGLTWHQEHAAHNGNVTIAWAIAPASPSAGTVTASQASNLETSIEVWQVTGFDPAEPVGATLTAKADTGTLSAAPAASSMVLSMVGDTELSGTFGEFTDPAGYTSLIANRHNPSYSYESAAYKLGSASQTVAWTQTTKSGPALVAVEIKAATEEEEEEEESATVQIGGSAAITADASAEVRAIVPGPAPIKWGKLAATPHGNPFSYYSYDLLTGAFIGQVPLRGVSFGEELNAAGTLTGTLDTRDPRVQATNPRACTIPNRTLIAVDYQSSIVGGGIVLPRKPVVESTPQATTGTLEVQCSGIWAWFAQRVQATDYSAPPYSGITGLTPMSLWPQTPWDASLIVCQILEDAIGYSDHLSMPYGDLLGGLGVLLNGEVPSGANPVTPEEFWVAINYPYTSAQTIETIISQLAQMGLGVAPDIGVDLAYSAGPASPPIGTINVAYPRRGRTVEENHLMIDLTTARKYSFPENGAETANQVYEIGGSGALVVDQNIYPLEQGYPLWERVMSRAQIQSQHITSILGQIGVSDLAMYSYAPVTPTITLSAFDPNLPLGSYTVGDDVRVYMPATAPDGQVFDPEFPEGLDQEWRITGWKTTVADEGDALTEFTLAQPPYLQAIAPAV